MPFKPCAVFSELLFLVCLCVCVAVFGERAHDGQLAFHFWFWKECWRLGLHVLLCGEWLPPSSAISGDQVHENVFSFPARTAPVLLTGKSLTLWFVFREGAIDRLVNIYKNVVHKTGVRVLPLPLKMPGCVLQSGLVSHLCCSLTCRATSLKVGLWTCSGSRWSCWLLGKLKTVFSKRGKTTM